MAILSVGPLSTYASIADAMVDAVSGDSVVLESGYSNETATIAQNGIIVDGDAASTGIILKLGSGIAIFTLTGEAPIAIVDGLDGNGIVGNAGGNVITVSSGVDAVDSGPGTDRLIVDYQLATGSITGNSTSNFTEAGGGGRSVTITDGTIENFTVLTGTQADTITTGGGDDFINVSDGANTVTAGNGNNTIIGGANADTFTAGNGNNFIDAGDGANTVIAGQGANTIVGGSGTDVMTALDGDNIIEGGDGTNVLTSGAGDDTITSGNGAATIVAGGGEDLITVKGGASTVDAGLGDDQLIIDYAAMITDITGGITSGNILTGYSGHIEDSVASSVDFVATENLTILGGSGNDSVVSGDGIDATEGNDGNDTLTSGNGDDQFTGGAGDDELNGGAGIDTAFYSGARSDYTITFDLDDNPTLVVDNRAGSPDGTDTLTGIEMANFAINSVPTGSVIITGTPTEDHILIASNTLVDADGLGAVSYHWQANGTDIAGATDASLTLTQAQVGSTITVLASYTDGQGTAEAIGSDATTPVANVNDLPTGAVIVTGTPTEGEILTASSTLADEDGLGTLEYHWMADGVDVAGDGGPTLLLTQETVGKVVAAVVFYTDQQGTLERVESAPTIAVANVNDLPVGAVIITGTPTEDQILTASNTLVDADGLGAVSYQWQANGTNIAGATDASLTLTQAQVGSTITVLASYTDGQGTAEAVGSDATTPVANVNDLPTGAVIVTGTPTEGEILTASSTLADEDGLGTLEYHWMADGVDVAGDGGPTLLLTQETVGKVVAAVVFYTDQQGTLERVESAPTIAVANVNDLPVGAVIITGTPTEDQILTASNTLVDADGLGAVSYQWQANGTNIAGATDASLTLTQAQVGSTITVLASYTDGQGTAEAVGSDATTPVANVNDLPTGAVIITGTPTEGEILTASSTLADEDGLGTIGYQWQANGSNIAGATNATFTLTQAQVGRTITVLASYTDGQGTTEAVGSDATTPIANVHDLPTGSVIITGTPTEDQILTVSNTLVDADGLGAVSYQWQANGTNIAGATDASLTLTQAQVGSTITVLASYTDGQGTAEAVGSDATTPVANVNDLPTGAVIITGTPTEGEILTASSTLADEDGLGTIGYQWQFNGTNIDGATNATFTLTQAQVGRTITVLASYTDQQGTPESVGSAATGIVAPPTLPFYQYTLTASGTAGQTEAVLYKGPVGYLLYEFAGSSVSEAVVGTASNDFIHLGAGKDAANGGEGDDVLDGGTGSNFLSGGAGRDVFFLDGRNGETTWSTITDWHAGDELVHWGWVQGVSRATWLADAGVEGYRGATLHADLDGNGVIDTSVTWAGRKLADLPASTQQDGLLWFA